MIWCLRSSKTIPISLAFPHVYGVGVAKNIRNAVIFVLLLRKCRAEAANGNDRVFTS
jgi:hypothetical protein